MCLRLSLCQQGCRVEPVTESGCCCWRCRCPAAATSAVGQGPAAACRRLPPRPGKLHATPGRLSTGWAALEAPQPLESKVRCTHDTPTSNVCRGTQTGFPELLGACLNEALGPCVLEWAHHKQACSQAARDACECCAKQIGCFTQREHTWESAHDRHAIAALTCLAAEVAHTCMLKRCWCSWPVLWAQL